MWPCLLMHSQTKKWCQLCRYWRPLFDMNLVARSGITGCHNYLRCLQWRQSWHRDNSLLSVFMFMFIDLPDPIRHRRYGKHQKTYGHMKAPHFRELLQGTTSQLQRLPCTLSLYICPRAGHQTTYVICTQFVWVTVSVENVRDLTIHN